MASPCPFCFGRVAEAEKEKKDSANTLVALFEFPPYHPPPSPPPAPPTPQERKIDFSCFFFLNVTHLLPCAVQHRHANPAASLVFFRSPPPLFFSRAELIVIPERSRRRRRRRTERVLLAVCSACTSIRPTLRQAAATAAFQTRSLFGPFPAFLF